MSKRGTVLVTCALLATAACGLGGNKAEVCRDSTEAFQDFNKRLEKVSPNDAAQWNRATRELGGELDRLSKKASDDELKRALADMAGKWKRVEHGSKQSAAMQAELQAQPKRLYNLCT